MPTHTTKTTIATEPRPLLTPREAADFLRLKVDTLRIWRRDRRGPSWTKVGGRVLYRQEDLQQYLQDRTVRTRSK